jgi:HSP20 family protein
LAQFGTGLQAFEDAMSRMFNENYGNFAVRTLSPPVDIVENENELVLTADLPGVPMENIDIRIEDGTLAISGERRFEEKEEKAGYHRIERAYGSFKRCFTLPDSIDAEKVAAEYTNGVLRVTMPKKEIAKPRSIKVALPGK